MDKPQSKLWFMDSHWWAILPENSGPTVWERNYDGWIEHKGVQKDLKGLPGRADVWYKNKEATAVGVSDSSLYIFRITPKQFAPAHVTAKVLGHLKIPQKNPKIETATITRDSAGVWWVAADVGGHSVYVWSSKDAVNWSDGFLIGENLNQDDICSIADVKGAVLVIWSNQNGDFSVNCREHKNGRPEADWSETDTIASGHRTADDHINTALSADGTLWVNTKNSYDKLDHSQLVLRVRNSEHQWKNYPYFPRTNLKIPSRPVVFTTPHPNLILLGATIYNRKDRNKGRVVFGVVDTASAQILEDRTTVIAPDSSLAEIINNVRKGPINNITGPKQPFPANGPWIILASDSRGNVYEANLRDYFGKGLSGF